MQRVRLKVCCIQSEDEVRLAIDAGADALGLVAAMPSGPGPIPEERIAWLARCVPPPVATFLLTCETTAEAIVVQHRRCGTTAIQLVDAVEHSTIETLRRELPGVGLVQVIHVREPASVDEALDAAARVDLLLLDSGNPSLAVKELGGTGRVHDWQTSAEIVRRSPVPVFLAGGLRAANVAEAITTVRPFGLDICTGVRTDGALDATKLGAFVAAMEDGMRSG